jgi:hypothetical protein
MCSAAKSLLFRRRCHRGFLVRILLLKALHAARCINEFLLTGEEWMAIRANFHANHLALDGGPGIKRVPAGAVHLHGMIIGMNSFFHGDAPNWLAGLRNLQNHSCVARPTKKPRL